eukprot:m.26036 g.26036  ORF g.26036 m.26036 type:complete len:636 (-) comp4524_c0_seq1:67-1974(-)
MGTISARDQREQRRIAELVCLPPVTAAAASTAATVAAVAATIAAAIAATTAAVATAVATAAVATATATEATTAVARRFATGARIAANIARATTGAATTTTTATVRGAALEKRRNLLLRFAHEVDEAAGDVHVLLVKERRGDAEVADATGTADAVDVLLDIAGKVVVDDMLDVGNVETAGSNCRGDENGGAARAEAVEGVLALALRAVAVDRRAREALVVEKVLEAVGAALRLNKDEHERIAVGGRDNVEEKLFLLALLHPDNLLRNVVRGGADAADGKEDVVVKKVACKELHLLGERGAKHERDALAWGRHRVLLHDAANLRLETHVQHAVSLIQDEVANVVEANSATLHHVNETSRRGDKQLAAALKLAHLRADVGATVHDAWAHGRAVRELASLGKDLARELARRRENEGKRVLLGAAAALGRRHVARALFEEALDDGEEKTSRLARAGLGAGHEVALVGDNGDRVLLDGRGLEVVGELEVVVKNLAELHVGKLLNVLGDVVAGGVDGDVLVLVKVDASVLAAEQLGLDALIARAKLLPVRGSVRRAAAAVAVARAATVAAPASTAVAVVAAAPAFTAVTAVTAVAPSAAAIRRLRGGRRARVLAAVAQVRGNVDFLGCVSVHIQIAHAATQI